MHMDVAAAVCWTSHYTSMHACMHEIGWPEEGKSSTAVSQCLSSHVPCRLRIGLITEVEQYKFCYRLIADALGDMLAGG